MWIAVSCLCLAVLAVTSGDNVTNPAPPPESTCSPNKLTVYKMVLHTFWSRTTFPKHYPDWRPPAQWSKVFGRSHDKSTYLYRLGQKSSQGVKTFAETGRSDVLEVQSQGQRGIFDVFNAPSVAQGVGRTEAKFFVDGNHSLVSLMSRIIPSPDWFIGIDSFDLCINGNWLDSITIEVDPVDAGTDNGFTFTAPNWATEPQGEAYRITAHYPAHPAGSFFYPYLRKLPSIATFQFIKLKEYELNEVFHHAEDDRKYDVVNAEEMVQDNNINIFNGNKDFQMAINEEREEMENHINYKPADRPKLYETLTTTLSSTRSWANDRMHNSIDPGKQVTPSTVSGSNVVSLGNKDAILNGIAQFYTNPKKNDKPRHKKNRRTKKYYKKYRPPRDCRVSDWSEWSPCSKSCGIGEMTRRREVKKHAKRGGRLCPPLLETKWCGSARSCNKQYFDW
ncbi:spondin-2 [Harmonia axyridis]|uniref:spondin-2 n=1 Tax=Harmonia axyridis TaxID=115357 RepID=UPI001E2787D2|nr:spondin-2 [Harmonia axyridis]